MTDQPTQPGSRSRADYSPGHQLYALIEFCNSRKSLWGKLESGRYEWLGVKPDGRTFVLGSPPRRGLRGGYASATWGETGATGEHRVTVEVPSPRSLVPSVTKCATAESARECFRSKVAKLETPDGSSGLWRVRLYVDDRLEDETLALRLMPNFYGGLSG